MASLSEIDRDAVLKAIAECDELGREAFLKKYGYGEAKSFFLREAGKLYDSKAIVGVARRYVRPDLGPLSHDDFSGGLATVAPVLEALGFEVLALDAAQKFAADLKRQIEERSIWWVNNKQTFEHEVGGNYLWSPVTRADGGRNHFYDNMTRVRPGDVVFAYADAQIKAVGVCSAPAVLMPKPTEFGAAGDAWSDDGWMLPVNFSKLKQPLRVKDHMDVLAGTLPSKYSPIRETGDGNQGAYLAAVPDAMAEVLISLLGQQWHGLRLYVPENPDALAAAIEDVEDTAEKVIQNRTDIGETEKLTLVQSRRGQGVYRANLEGFEKCCRVTGVSNLRHLRASHIKPWRVSTNHEKLDGNNGLLLSPHVDHLFDQGYISFDDDGTLLLAHSCDRETLAKWMIKEGQSCGAFRREQLPYLAYHREFVLKKT